MPKNPDAKTNYMIPDCDTELAAFRAEANARCYPPLTPEQVVVRAVAKAHSRACGLFDGLKVLESMTGDDNGDVTIHRDTLEWLAGKFKTDADDIMTDMDHAQHALAGKVYCDANVRYVARDYNETPQ